MTRIISGVAGSLRIEVPPSGTRPTSDRVREAIFSTLDSWGFTHATHVLDLYAGSGALGLEAASRGAASVTLVEKHQRSARVTERNARVIRGAFEREGSSAPPSVRVVQQSAQTFLDQQSGEERWDVVLLDPPYDLGETALAANLQTLLPTLRSDAAVLVERSVRSPEPSWPAGLRPVKKKRYGETVLWWAEPSSADEPRSE